MGLTLVTMTGADSAEDWHGMIELSKEYPYVEWGILIGSNDGGPRFPWLKDIHKLAAMKRRAKHRVNLSLHVCGSFLRDISHGYSTLNDPSVLGDSLYEFNRVQLNWHGAPTREHTAANVRKAFESIATFDWEPTLIFQLDGKNDELYRGSFPYFKCAGLFDTSHGAGVLPGQWPDEHRDLVTGWAGGLGPENLDRELPKIHGKISHDRQQWVDMETRIRDEDGDFCLKKVRDALDRCYAYIVAHEENDWFETDVA